ncbi:hypothetical protein GCM10027176_62930 [Actinoallomurus bryophytorum]
MPGSCLRCRAPPAAIAGSPTAIAALLTYRALAKGCGPREARAIMHAVHAGDLPGALALLDAAHAALHERRRSLDARAAVTLSAPPSPGSTRA